MTTTLTQIEIFKTNVEYTSDAILLTIKLHQQFPGSQFNFDLDDCDKILRVAGKEVQPDHVVDFVQRLGFYAEKLL